MIRYIILSCISLLLISCGGGSDSESSPDKDEQKTQIKEEWKGYWKNPSNFFDYYINITGSNYKAYTYSEAYQCLSEIGDHEITEVSDTGFTYYSQDKQQDISINIEITENSQLKVTWLDDNGEESNSTLYNSTDLLSPTLCSENTVAGTITGIIKFQNLPNELTVGNESLIVSITTFFDVNNNGIFDDSDIEITLENLDIDEAVTAFDYEDMKIVQKTYGSIFQFNRFNSLASYSVLTEDSTISFTIDRSEHIAYKHITQDTQVLVEAKYHTAHDNGATISSSDNYPEANTYTSGLDTRNLIDSINDYHGTHNYLDISTVSITVE